MDYSNDKIGAVIVLYQPDLTRLKENLSSLSSQVDFVMLIDNSSVDNEEKIIQLGQNVHYTPLMSNTGIAKALNIGIEKALEARADFILLSDQDSVISEECVGTLLSNYHALNESGIKVGVVGTRAINRKTGKPYHAMSKEVSTIAAKTIANTSVITECYSVITSVSLIPRETLIVTGGMDESLFIDGVDHEWCWRAWHTNKLRSFIIEDATIEHELGRSGKAITKQDISIAQPMRLRYQLRNYIWLRHRDYTPRFWKKKHLIKYMEKIIYYPIFISPRWEYVKAIAKGIREGLEKRNETGHWPTFQN